MKEHNELEEQGERRMRKGGETEEEGGRGGLVHFTSFFFFLHPRGGTNILGDICLIEK